MSNNIYKDYKKAVDETAIVSKTDPKGIITYVNSKFCEISGYSKEELLGKSHNIVRHPDTPKSIFADMWYTIKDLKQAWQGEVRNRRKDGTDYVVEAIIVPQVNELTNEIIGYMGIRYDITRLDAERQLNEKILESQDDFIIIGNKKTGIEKINPAFFSKMPYMNLFHFKSSHKSIMEIFENISEIDSVLLSRLEDGQEVEIPSVRIKDIHEQIRVYTLKQKPINGNHYIITLNDVTSMQELITQAQHESHMKSSFLAVMSHEIRTPLNGIMPYVELLLQTKLTKEQSEYLQIIHKSSNSLLRVINDILDFSKIESGKLEIENINFNAVKEFESIVDLYVAKANEKNIDFCVFIDPTIPTCLYGDPIRLKQIISNLLSNAIKFTDCNGEIQFFVEFKGTTSDNKAKLEIEIRDSGKGIPKEKQEQIFTPFSQEDGSISRRFGGTGLGLSISQDLAKMMGTKIQVHSVPNKGSMFYFYIDLPIIETCKVQFETAKTNMPLIGIYIAKEEVRKCATILNRYFESFGFKYRYITNKKESDICDVIFVISTGRDSVEWINNSLLQNKRVIAVIPSKIENANKFRVHTTIQMPINGSKIYDAIIESDKIKDTLNAYYNKKQEQLTSKYDATVLLAEDNHTNQKVAMALLKKFDIDVIIANDGQEAFEIYKQRFNDIDLILMDIHMPIVDGIEATTMIREYESSIGLLPKTIIALTADAIKAHIQKYSDAGMNDFLSKPIELDNFNKAINSYLSSKKKSNFGDKDIEDNQENMNNTSSINNDCINIIRVSQINLISQNLELDLETSEIIYDEFQNNWRELKVKLNNAIELLEYETIRSIAHQLKGACGSIRFDEASNAAKVLEHMARDTRNGVDIVEYREIYNEIVGKIEVWQERGEGL